MIKARGYYDAQETRAAERKARDDQDKAAKEASRDRGREVALKLKQQELQVSEAGVVVQWGCVVVWYSHGEL